MVAGCLTHCTRGTGSVAGMGWCGRCSEGAGCLRHTPSTVSVGFRFVVSGGVDACSAAFVERITLHIQCPALSHMCTIQVRHTSFITCASSLWIVPAAPPLPWRRHAVGAASGCNPGF